MWFPFGKKKKDDDGEKHEGLEDAAVEKAKSAEEIKQEAAALQGFFKNLSAKEVVKLSTAVEMDRMAGGAKFPHDSLLTMLRPHLKTLKPERFPTPQRILCVPFEDMLITDRGASKKQGQISRNSIMPMWKLVEELIPDTIEFAEKKLNQSVAEHNSAAFAEAAHAMWEGAAKALQAKIDEVKKSDYSELKWARHVLGGKRRYEDLIDMVNTLHIATYVERLKDELPPKPIRTLHDPDLAAIDRIYKELLELDKDLEVYVVFVVLGRLKQPSEILKVIRVVTGRTDDTVVQGTSMSAVGEIVMENLDNTARDIQLAVNAKQEESAIIELVMDYAEEFSGITKNMGIRRDGQWGNRMLETRKKVGDTISEKVLDTASDTVMDALPGIKRRTRSGKTEQIPDVTEMPDDDQLMLAEKRVTAVRDVAKVADKIAAQKSATDAMNQLKNDLSEFGSNIINQMEGEVKVKNDVDRMESHLLSTVHLLEMVAGPEEADMLRRKGMIELKKVTEEGGND